MAVHRLLHLPIDLALVLPLGAAVAAVAYWASLVLGAPWLFPIVIASLDLALLFPRGGWKLAQGPSLRGALAPIVTLAVFLALTQYPWNRPGPQGEFLLDPLLAFDTAFHVGLARELTLGYPPQVPGLSGFPLGYHLGSDLGRGATLRWAHIDPYDSISRFDLTLGAVALVFVLRGAARRLGAPPLAVALVGWTPLATDLSFLFAGNTSAHWWADLLRGNLLLSLALANPVVPALALALGCLVGLSRYEAGEGREWLLLSAALGAGVPFFKVFLGAHLLLGLAVAFLFASSSRRACLVTVALPCAVVTAALALGQGGQTVSVTLAPLDLARTTRETLGLPALGGGRLALWSSFWLLASLGVRLLGLAPAGRALRGGGAAGSALAAMALAGWPLGLLFDVSAPEVLAGQKHVNDAGYLVEQAGALLWIFTAVALSEAATRRHGLVVLAAAVLAFPSTLQFVVKKHGLQPDPIPAPMVRAMKALEKVSRPGDVVMQRPAARFPPVPVILIGRRVPYERFTPYLTQFASREDLLRRHETVYRFFHTTDAAEALTIARSLEARYLCLYGADRVRFDAQGRLEAIHEEPGARCYRLGHRPLTLFIDPPSYPPPRRGEETPLRGRLRVSSTPHPIHRPPLLSSPT